MTAANLNQRTHNRAHHVMQEGVARNINCNEFLASLFNFFYRKALNKTMRRLAFGRNCLAEALKVVLSHQRLRRLVHKLCVQVAVVPPRVIPAQHGASATCTNSIAIRTRLGIKACREALWGAEELSDRDVVVGQSGKRADEFLARQRQLSAVHGKAHVLGLSMHAGVGSARAGELNLSAQNGLKRATKVSCNGALGGLLGKAAESSAAVAQLDNKRSFRLSRSFSESLRS